MHLRVSPSSFGYCLFLGCGSVIESLFIDAPIVSRSFVLGLCCVMQYFSLLSIFAIVYSLLRKRGLVAFL